MREYSVLKDRWPMADGFEMLKMQTKVISVRAELARSSAVDVMI
jgi:hypothetical protein